MYIYIYTNVFYKMILFLLTEIDLIYTISNIALINTILKASTFK